MAMDTIPQVRRGAYIATRRDTADSLSACETTRSMHACIRPSFACSVVRTKSGAAPGEANRGESGLE